MARYEGSYLIIDESESASFRERVQHPDPEAIRRRDQLFAELDQMGIVRNPDGSMDIPFSPKHRPISSTERTWQQGTFGLTERAVTLKNTLRPSNMPVNESNSYNSSDTSLLAA